MADEIKKEVEARKPKTEIHKIKKEVTIDKLYKVGNEIELPNGKLKETLISKKII